MPENGWDDVYRNYRLEDIPWHMRQPDRNLVRPVREKRINPGPALDMCSGAGTNSIYLASRGFRVTGVDISPTAVRIAEARCGKRGLKCEYLVGNVLETEFGGKFDFVFDRGCFHHISRKDKPRYVKRLKALLGNKGKFYLQCFSDKNPPFGKNLSREDIRGYFSGYFDIVFIKDSVHTEPDSGEKRLFYSVFMEKKEPGN